MNENSKEEKSDDQKASQWLQKEFVSELLRKQSKRFKAHGVKNIWIIGSVARDNAGVASDIDFVIQLTEGTNKFTELRKVVVLIRGMIPVKCDICLKETLTVAGYKWDEIVSHDVNLYIHEGEKKP